MASIDATIGWLEKLPEEIRAKGEQIAKDSIIRNGHVDTKNMLNSTRAFVHGTDIEVVVWTKYASYVNDGHAGAYGKFQSFKISPKWPGRSTKSGKVYPYVTYYQPGYGGSGFFDQAYAELLSYIRTL